MGVLELLSSSCGMQPNAVVFFFTVLSGVPLALFYRLFLLNRSPTIKHLFFTSTGLGLAFYNYESSTIHLLLLVAFSYAILYVLGPGKLSTAIVFFVTMVHLLYGYVTKMNKSSLQYQIAWVSTGCLLVLRLISLAFDYADGQIPLEKRNADQKRLALKNLPSFLEVLSCSFFFGTCPVGSHINVAPYVDFVNGRLFNNKHNQVPSGSYTAGLRCFLECLVGLVFMIKCGKIVESSFLLSAEFEALILPARIVCVIVWYIPKIIMYGVVWKVSECTCCIVGLSYSGTDENGHAKWNAARQINLPQFFLISHLTHVPLNFNISTHLFLKRYIFKRLAFLGSKNLSMFLTAVFVTIWHGTKFGYTYTFVLSEIPFILMENQLIPVLKNLTGIHSIKSLHPAKCLLVRIVACVYVLIFTSYGFLGMGFLDLPQLSKVLSAVCFFGHMIPIIWFLAYFLLLRPLKLDAPFKKD